MPENMAERIFTAKVACIPEITAFVRLIAACCAIFGLAYERMFAYSMRSGSIFDLPQSQRR
jgi:hypothetical protein